ncbi:MAG: LysM peptidoglycan-binding domain-containing protein [Proteobacteria bacterium]|nr:LysM peptidoglycan-binding domain-containing protein [Pseudomonadota bacterium]
MMNIKPVSRLAGILMAILITATNAWAEEEQDQEQEQEQEYIQDMKPGLHFYADSSSGSVLAEAARSGGSVVISASDEEFESAPKVEPGANFYTVQQGDTLWDICSSHFGDPYVWPRIWSYNPKITNPNWIYPGDAIWLVPTVAEEMLSAPALDELRPQGTAISKIQSSLLVRNRGFVDKEVLKKSGMLVGAHKAVKLIGQYDESYVYFKETVQVRPGDEFAAFHVLRPVDAIEDPDTEVGYLVEILGQVRVTSFNKDSRIARVVVDESIRIMERGTLIGPVHRRFDIIPTIANGRDLEGHLVAFLDPVILAATDQIVFVDRGTEHGVREGNRFFAIERRDNWRRSRNEPDDRDGYPKEVLAELRVVEARPQTSTCLITSSIRELEVGQKVEMLKGY